MTVLEAGQRELKTLAIDRARWHRGRGADGSALLLKDGSMCCLGFYCGALGLSGEQLLGSTRPSFVGVYGWLAECYAGGERRVEEVLMQVNDSRDLIEEVREKLLASIFWANGGVEVAFE